MHIHLYSPKHRYKCIHIYSIHNNCTIIAIKFDAISNWNYGFHCVLCYLVIANYMEFFYLSKCVIYCNTVIKTSKRKGNKLRDNLYFTPLNF